MTWRSRPVSVLMRPLLSRGALVAVMLLTVTIVASMFCIRAYLKLMVNVFST